MRVNLVGKDIEVRPFTWGEYRRMFEATGLDYGKRIDENSTHTVVQYGLKVQGHPVTDEDLDTLPYGKVQRIFLELMRQEEDGAGPNPTGSS